MMISNIIDIYLSGIMVGLINLLLYSRYFGFTLSTYSLYLSSTKIEVCLVILFVQEIISIIFQSLTLSNRLSINILAGSLLINLLQIVSCIVYYRRRKKNCSIIVKAIGASISISTDRIIINNRTNNNDSINTIE